jgi:cytochrome P450
MQTLGLKRRVLATAGVAARYVPIDGAQLFAFVANPAVRAEPWPLYRRLHERGSIRATRFGVWLVGSHEVVTDILRNAPTTVDERRAEGLPKADPAVYDKPFSRLITRTLLFTDPPDHARLRRLVAGAFTPRRVEELRPRVADLVQERLAALRPRGEADLLAELALPLPVAVICELLGVRPDDRARFLRYAKDLAPRLDISLFRDEEKERLGDEAALGLEALLLEMIGDPGRRLPDGLLAALVELEQDGDRFTADEVVALCALLLAAGFETTTNLIGNGLLALLSSPAELARVRDGDVDPATAVDELLRFDSPVQFTQRVLVEDYQVGGQTIPAKTLVALLLGAANRDPAAFADPDRLDVGRTPNPHLAFSSGIHHCVGAALARLEGSIAIPAVLQSLPDLRLTAKPGRRDTFVLRGLTSLPVAWRA